MKQLIIICICIGFIASTALAGTVYISEVLEITVRTGPGIDHKVISMIKTGDRVTILESGKSWTRIEMAGGKTGWVLSRFLTSEVPSKIALAKLKNDHNKLLEQSAAPLAEIARLNEANEKLTIELDKKKKALSELHKEYEQLKSESTDFIKIKTQYQQASSRLKTYKNKSEKLESEVNKLMLGQYTRWFLSGAGVLVLGFIIGFSTKKQRRRSSLL